MFEKRWPGGVSFADRICLWYGSKMDAFAAGRMVVDYERAELLERTGVL